MAKNKKQTEDKPTSVAPDTTVESKEVSTTKDTQVETKEHDDTEAHDAEVKAEADEAAAAELKAQEEADAETARLKAEAEAEELAKAEAAKQAAIDQINKLDEETLFDVKATVLHKYVLTTFSQYVKDMAPNRSQTIETVSRHQVTLYRALTKAINDADIGELAVIMRDILTIIEANRKTSFSELYLFRGQSDVAMSAKARRNFEEIFNVLLHISNPAKRNPTVQETIDFTSFLSQTDLSEATRERLVSLIKNICSIG